MDPVIDVNGSHPQPLDPLRSQRRKQHRRINSAAECNNQPDVGEARQQLSQARNEPLRAEWLRGYLSRTLGESAERGDASGTRHTQLVAGQGFELIQVAKNGSLEPLRGLERVAVRPTQWLLHDLVHQPEFAELIRCEIERICRGFFLVLALPQNGGAAFR